FGLLSVVLRGAQITAQSLVLGGVVFLTFLVAPLAATLGPVEAALAAHTRRWVAIGAGALTLVIALVLAIDGSVLATTADLTFGEVIGADFFISGCVVAAAALGIVWAAGVRRDRALLLFALAIVAATAATSHAAARIDGRLPLLIADVLHQGAAAVWIGGIPYFLFALS